MLPHLKGKRLHTALPDSSGVSKFRLPRLTTCQPLQVLHLIQHRHDNPSTHRRLLQQSINNTKLGHVKDGLDVETGHIHRRGPRGLRASVSPSCSPALPNLSAARSSPIPGKDGWEEQNTVLPFLAVYIWRCATHHHIHNFVFSVTPHSVKCI